MSRRGAGADRRESPTLTAILVLFAAFAGVILIIWALTAWQEHRLHTALGDGRVVVAPHVAR